MQIDHEQKARGRSLGRKEWGMGAVSPTLGGSRSNKLKEGQAEGEGIQTPEAGLRLGWKIVTPAGTGERTWRGLRRV